MKISWERSLGLVALLASAACSLAAQTSGGYNGQGAPPPGPMQPGPMQPGPMQPGPMQPGPIQPGPMQPGFEGSARAGSLNYLEGQVSSNGQALNRQSVGHFAMQAGQSLETGNGYAEVLLTPGAFLRVGPNSEFRLTSVGLADTRINLTRGSALVEADLLIEGTHLEVTVGTTSIDLLKKGLYEFAANPPDVKTFEGKAMVVSLTKKRDIGKNDQILLAGNDSLKKTSFDAKQAKTDQLYVWSEARSREESAQNKLVAQNSSGYAPTGEGWFWDPYVNYYGFWPPGYLYSPFGFGFYGGFYPGFYGGYYGGYRHFPGLRVGGGVREFSGFHGNGVSGSFHSSGGFQGGGGFHGGGGHR